MTRPPLPQQGDQPPWGDKMNAHVLALGTEIDGLDTRVTAVESSPGGGDDVGVTDHGALTGLADDDHPQYLTQSRGDARYAPKDGGGGGGGDALPSVGSEGDVLTTQSGAWVASPPMANGVDLVPPEQLGEADSLVVWVQGTAYRTTLADLSEYFGAMGGGPGGGGGSGGVQFAPGTLNITQGGVPGAVQFGLTQAPTADVTLTFTSPFPSLVAPNKASITFTSANFATPQQVTFDASTSYLTGNYNIEVTWASTSTDFAYVGLNGKVKVNVTGTKVAAPLFFPHPNAVMADDFSQGGFTPDNRVPIPIGTLGPWNAPVPATFTISGGSLRNPQPCGAAIVVPIGNRTTTYVMHLVLDPYVEVDGGKPSMWPGLLYPGATGNKGVWHEITSSYNAQQRDPYYFTNGGPAGGAGAAVTGTASFTGPVAGTLYDFYVQVNPATKTYHYMGNPRPGTPAGAMTTDMSASASPVDISGNAFGWGGYNSNDAHGIKQIQCIPDLDLKTLFGV